jgi:nitrilase
MGSVRAAVVQAASVAYDPDATVAKAARLAEAAARDGAQLIVFPEAFVSAYPRGLGFGAVVGSRSDEGRDTFLRYWRSAIDVPGPHVDQLAEVAGDLRAFLVVGAVEREGGTLYCSVLFFEPEGTLLATHRKVMPTGSERLIWGFGDGSTLIVHDTAIGRMATAVCWENYMPLLRARLYRQNVQLWLAPTADARDVWIASMRHIAVEGRCFVLSCNQYARRSDYPDDYDASFGDGADPVVTRGGSCIIDPFGNLLAGPNYGEEAILVRDLDLGETIRGKFDLDVAGHYSRSDIFGPAPRPETTQAWSPQVRDDRDGQGYDPR